MKLSKETLSIIKNYANINSNLLFKPGNTISTIAVGSEIMSTVTVAETFPEQFGIYDVNELLGALSLFNDPNLTFDDKTLLIKEGNSSIKWFKASEEAIVAPKKDIVFPQAEIEFKLDSAVLNNILKTAPLLKATDVSFVGNGTTISVVVSDKKNKTANSYQYDICPSSLVFKVNIKVDNLKLISGNYDVSISSKKISRFVSQSINSLIYYVAIEADSTFEI